MALALLSIYESCLGKVDYSRVMKQLLLLRRRHMQRWILEGMVLSWLQQIPTAAPAGARHCDDHIFTRPYIKPINFKPRSAYTSIPSTFPAPVPSPSLTQAWFVFLCPYFHPDPSGLSPENTAKLLMSLSLKSSFAEARRERGRRADANFILAP